MGKSPTMYHDQVLVAQGYLDSIRLILIILIG